MTTREDRIHQEVANEILRQLGGEGRLRAMLGVKLVAYDGPALVLTFRARAKDGINKIRVRLDPSDTYTVTFWKIRGIDVKQVDESSGVYVDNLREVIESTTGLALSL